LGTHGCKIFSSFPPPGTVVPFFLLAPHPPSSFSSVLHTTPLFRLLFKPTDFDFWFQRFLTVPLAIPEGPQKPRLFFTFLFPFPPFQRNAHTCESSLQLKACWGFLVFPKKNRPGPKGLPFILALHRQRANDSAFRFPMAPFLAPRSPRNAQIFCSPFFLTFFFHCLLFSPGLHAPFF